MSSGIRFPKMHIAASVVNRIMNVHAGIKAQPRPLVSREPMVADPTLEGGMIDQQLAQPTQPVAGDPALGQAVVAKGMGL